MSPVAKILFIVLLLVYILGVTVWLCIGLVFSLNLEATLSTAENTAGSCVGTLASSCTFTANDALGLCTSPTAYTVHDALIMADLCGRIGQAYDSSTSPTTPPGMTFVQTVSPPHSKYLVGIWRTGPATGGGTMYIVYRGTANSKEWQADFMVAQEPWAGSVIGGDGQGSLVHSGFIKLFREVQAAVQLTLDTYQPAQVYTTGHSLGAALATMSSLQFLGRSTTTYIFGSPRVGNAAFVTLVANNCRVFRVANQSDVICDAPLAVMPNLSKPHLPWLYDHVAVTSSFNINWGSWKNNHLMPVYIYWLRS